VSNDLGSASGSRDLIGELLSFSDASLSVATFQDRTHQTSSVLLGRRKILAELKLRHFSSNFGSRGLRPRFFEDWRAALEIDSASPCLSSCFTLAFLDRPQAVDFFFYPEDLSHALSPRGLSIHNLKARSGRPAESSLMIVALFFTAGGTFSIGMPSIFHLVSEADALLQYEVQRFFPMLCSAG
jgi:hypothetical protein